MKINHDYFSKLSLSSKSSYLWSYGELVFTRRNSESFIKLYLLFGFFVEVYYDIESLQIEKIMVLDSKVKLDIYERLIKLPSTVMA